MNEIKLYTSLQRGACLHIFPDTRAANIWQSARPELQIYDTNPCKRIVMKVIHTPTGEEAEVYKPDKNNPHLLVRVNAPRALLPLDLRRALVYFAQQWPELAAIAGTRIESGAHIYARGGQIAQVDAHTWTVKSQSNPIGGYTVNTRLKSCTCPDAGRVALCKHRVAVGLQIWFVVWEKEARLIMAGARAMIDAAEQNINNLATRLENIPDNQIPGSVYEDIHANIRAAEATIAAANTILAPYYPNEI